MAQRGSTAGEGLSHFPDSALWCGAMALVRGITRPIIRPIVRSLVAGVNYDPAAQALFDRYTDDPGGDVLGWQNDFFVAAKDFGIYPKIDAMFMPAAHTANDWLLDWKRTAISAVAVNSPVFEQFRGGTGNGSSSRIRTNFTPSTDGVNFAQADAGLWAWCRTDIASVASVMGSNTGPAARFIPRRSTSPANAVNCVVNDGTSTNSDATVPDSIGFFGATRLAGLKKMWRNGAQVGSSISVASTGVASQEQWILGASSTIFSTIQVAFAAWTSALDGLELAWDGIVRTYLQRIGAA